MCGGGGSRTTNVTETGLGDDQFDNLQAGQETIRSDISGLGTAAEERYNTTVDTLGSMADANATGFANVDSSLTGLGTDMSTGFADVLTGQDDLATSVDTRLTQTDENIATGFENVGNDITDAEDYIVNVVDQRGDEIVDDMATGFTTTNENLNTGFSTLTDTVNTNDAVLLDATNTGFDTTNENIDAVGTAIGDQLTETSSNVLTGQEAISALIDKYGGDAATYYQDLAKGQATIQENQGTMQTAFDGYLTDFGDYTTLANQTRTDLGNSIVGGFETMGQVMGDQATATSEGFSSVGDAVADVTSDVASAADTAETNFGDIAASISGVGTDVQDVGTAVGSAADDADTNFGSIATDIASGFTDQTTEGAARKKSFVDTLASVQDILQADTGSLSEQVKSNYQSVVDSFDDQGNLITETVTNEGGLITRALSDQGELFIAQFDANGVRMDQQTLDLNSLLNNVSTFESNMDTQFTSIFGDAELAAESRQSILDAFTVTDSLIGDIGTGVTSELTNNFDLLSAAFDEQGNFLADSIDDNGNTITRSLDENGNLITKSFDSTNELIDETTLNIGDISSQLNEMQFGLGDQLNTAFSDLASGNADANANLVAILGDVSGQIDTVGSGLGDQFTSDMADLQSSFDAQGNLIRSEITEAGTEIQRDLDSQGNLITTEISASGEVLSQTSLNIADISSQLNTMQAGLGDTITSAFDGIQNSSDELRANLVGNLAGLRNIMTTQGDTLGADLQEKFQALSDSFDSNGDLIRTAVDANGDFIFRELNANGELVISTIDDATGQLIESNKFNADLLTTDFDSRFNSTEEFLQAIDSSIKQVGGDIDQGLLGMASGLEEGFATRFDELSDQEREGRKEFNTRLLQVRALLEEDVADLDDGLRGRMTALSKSFDGEGRLIQNAIDANGNMIKRTIDDSGNLVLSTYSRMNGALLDQQALDINRLMKQIADRRISQGSNANMGGQSPTAGAPAPASVYSGFASPYAQTYS
jgi:hypothetical protein